MAFDLMERARQLAEQARNYNAGFAGTGQIGTPGTTGSEGGATSTYDPNAALPAVPWSGPAAYNMHPAGSEFAAGDEAEMYAALARAQQFDPNASLSQQVRTSGGEGGGIDQTYYTLNYDQSKVPAPVHAGLAPVGAYGSNESVYNENLLYDDPNYGVMTDPRNLKGNRAFDWLGVVGPLAVSAFGFGVPALAAGLSGGALGGAAGSAGAMPWYGQAGLATAKQVGSGQFDPYATTAAFAPGIADLGPAPVDNWDLLGNQSAYGLPPTTELNYGDVSRSVGAGARAAGGFNQLQQQRRGSAQTQLSYNPQNFGKLNQPMVPSGDTQAVANNFADSPYGFSYGGGP